MIQEDIIYLKCLECNGKLKLASFDQDKSECISGMLSCARCRKKYPVINAIPRIMSDDLIESLVKPHYPEFFAAHHINKREIKIKHTSRSSQKHDSAGSDKLKKKTASTFGFEWLKYPKILSQFEKDWARYFNPFITKENIRGKVVADIGCGMAKHGYFIGKYKAKKYIGLDLSMAVEAAYRNTRQFKPLIIQADIYAPPLRGEKIDLFYSIGVLHHLPYPEAGFLTITSMMKKKGAMILIWVYGRRKNARALLLYNPIRALTTRMPKFILYPLCHIPAALLHGINLAQKGMDKIRLGRIAKAIPFYYYTDFPYEFKVSDAYDVFGTPKQVYYDMKDIAAWFKRAKIKDCKLEHDIVQGIKGFGWK